MAGAWPPSSIVIRFICSPASAASCLPTAVEPVNEILRIDRCGMRYSEISAGTPIDKIDDAGRNAGIGEGADQFSRRGRRLFRRFDDDRAAGRQRRAELADDLIDRKIPWRECRDRADRLLEHQIGDVRRARRHDPAIGAAALLGEPIERVGGGERSSILALLPAACPARASSSSRSAIEPLAQQIAAARCRTFARSKADMSRQSAKPASAAANAASRSAISARGDLTDHLLGRGIDDIARAGARAGLPDAVDEEQNIQILRHARLSLRRGSPQLNLRFI